MLLSTLALVTFGEYRTTREIEEEYDADNDDLQLRDRRDTTATHKGDDGDLIAAATGE